MNQLIDLRVLTLIAFTLTNLAFLRQVKAVDPSDTFFGTGAFNGSSTGVNDSAFGFDALNANTSGSNNTAVGKLALEFNTTGSNNTATGAFALMNSRTINGVSGHNNTADGYNALNQTSTGSNNIASGAYAGYNLMTGSNNIDIGNLGVATESNTIRIGNAVATVYPDGTTHAAQTKTYIAGFTTAVTGSTVVVNATTHQVGMMTSSARFKDEIKPMNEASEAILALKPVTFRYKKDIDPVRTPQYGLVAEDVEKINPALITRDRGGKPYTVRYDAVNAMLLNEFLKEHKRVQDLEASVAQQRNDFQATSEQQRKEFESKITEQQKQIQALTAGLQKVSAQVDMSKPAPQMIVENR